MSTVYLIPSPLAAEGTQVLPNYILTAIKDCQVIFAENERTTRRYFKKIWKEIIINEYLWFTISHSSEPAFRQMIIEGKNIGIISEAGCPGVADPGQSLVAIAQQMNAIVKPLVGPNSILLALMASGMNGQQFQFVGYLPKNYPERIKVIENLELESKKKGCTQIFIETPYRNNQLLSSILKKCKSTTRLCIAVNLTTPNEWIKTKTIAEWQKNIPDIHKQQAIFLLLAREISE